jgi:hypothetical protein
MERYLVKSQVTWGYLAVPGSVLLGGVAHFCHIVWQTGKLKLPTWKESLYPTLAYALDEETQELLAGKGPDRRPKSAKNTSDDMYLRFGDDGDNLRLRVV